MANGNGRTDRDARYRQAASAHGAAIARLARGYERDPELCRDLVQEIHAALWRSFAYFEGQCSERSWVHRIAHNVAVSHLIARRRLRAETYVGLDAVEALAGEENVERTVCARGTVERLLAAIHRLAPADRQVVLLYLEDLSAAEIGEVTGLSAGAVAAHIHRLKALFARLFDTGERP